MRASRSATTIPSALVRLHRATAAISQVKAVPPGTVRRLRATPAPHSERPVDASNAAVWKTDGQYTRRPL